MKDLHVESSVGNRILFRRSHYIVVQSLSKEGPYYTIVNIKYNRHAHVYKNEYTAAILICKSAHKHNVPKKYPRWMKESIRRLIYNE